MDITEGNIIWKKGMKTFLFNVYIISPLYIHAYRRYYHRINHKRDRKKIRTIINKRVTIVTTAISEGRIFFSFADMIIVDSSWINMNGWIIVFRADSIFILGFSLGWVTTSQGTLATNINTDQAWSANLTSCTSFVHAVGELRFGLLLCSPFRYFAF